MNVKKLVSLLTCGFTILGANFKSMAMKENNEEYNENTNLIDNSIQRGPELHDFTENMLEECKAKNKKMFRVPYNDRWVLVNGDLSPFRMGSEQSNSDRNFFYYSFSDGTNDLKERIEKHPVQPSFGQSMNFKLPLSNNPSKSLIVTYVVGWPMSGVTYSYGSSSDQFDIQLLEKDKEEFKKMLRVQLTKRKIKKVKYLQELMKITGTGKINKNYIFETKDLFFLKDIREESEEYQIGKWFKENKEEIESYAKGFPWGKTVGGIGTAVLLEELIRRNLPKDAIEENRYDKESEQEELTDQTEVETEDEDI